MESRWRENVWRMGWNHGPFGLIARFVFQGGFAITDVRDGFGNAVMLVRSPAPELSWVTMTPQLWPVADLPFPYELQVEPD